MSYQVLARKWRPKSFDELVGQLQTATALTNALESQRLHHAYLFTGTRGVGKTTIARILSKSLNCERGISANPCGECASCVEIDQGNFVDLMEIDAASKTKVEDTRELLDNVQYRPTRGRYKVYLIDEVHMLSGHSFNALLKTLEEPPPHVLFLLATTDPQKLPATVLSRCLQFHLRRMEEQQIVDHLDKILASENVQFEQAALVPIAKGADGSMRDALSLLDQAIAYSGETITLATVLEMLGSIDQNFCIRLLECLESNDASAVMTLIKEMAQFSPDFIEVMSDWLNLLHQLAVIQATKDESDPELCKLANQVTPADLQLYYQLSLQAKKDLAYAPHPRQGFEMALLRVLAFRPKSTSSAVNRPVQDSSEAKKKLTNLSESLSDTKTVKQNSTRGIRDHDQTSPATVHQINEQNALPAEPQVNKSEPIPSQKSAKVELSIVANNSASDSNNFTENSRDNKLCSLIQTNNNEEVQNYTELQGKLKSQRIKQQDAQQQDIQQQDRLKQNLQQKDIAASAKISIEKLPYLERPLYPNEAKIELESISQLNWHIAVDQMKFQGNGQQVLINSLGEYSEGKLTIKYLKTIGHFLTKNLRDSLTKEIQKYFKQSQLKILLDPVDTIDISPKGRQVKIHLEAVEKAFQDLSSNTCIIKLQETIGAMIDRTTIVLK